MKCISPITLANPSLEKVKQKFITVPCGSCAFCLALRREDWAFRMQQEVKVCHTAKFVTITYTDEHLTYGTDSPTLVKSDVQTFIKRLRHQNLNNIMSKKIFATRKQANRESPTIRYFAVGEYGTQTHRPHYHLILFNVQPELLRNEKKITEIWGKGYVLIENLNDARVKYTLKYIINKDSQMYTAKEKPFQLISQGLGKNYLSEQNIERHVAKSSLEVRNRQGKIQRLPRYYKDKIFTRLDLEEINGKAIKKANKYHDEEILRLEKLGHKNPYTYLELQKQTQMEKILKKSKKSTL